ncbi:MAG: hypothetical protein IJ375_04110 [Oscillospiraceae bacterium]|nr:hypothetical protein [Oscillospiraceae bacterium]
MKRIFPLIILLLALSGCGTQKTIPAETLFPAETVTPEPTGFYDPDSALEAATGGAVQAYPLNRSDCYGLLPMGEDLLLFTGTDRTTLVKVSGANLYITAEAELDCAILPDSCGVQASEKGLTFYDEASLELVFLDTGLKEVSRVALPGDIQGSPALSADRKSLYYCTADALRVLDLETGFQKLLKEMFFADQTVLGLHCGGTVVECGTGSGTLYVSAETGETLWEALEEIALSTDGDAYFVSRLDGVYQELLVGTTDIGPYALYFEDPHAAATPLLEAGAAVLASSAEDGSAVTLHYFDLTSGKRTAALELAGSGVPRSVWADPETAVVWLLRYDDGYGCDTLLCWDPAASPTGDENVYLSSRYTYSEPDTEGLARCQEKAAELSIRYGVDVRVWNDAAAEAPADYSLTAEYQVPVIWESLELLDEALSAYPSGFLKELAGGTLRLCLVRYISGSPDDVAGIQYWTDRDTTCVCLRSDGQLAPNLYRELFHVIESRVFSTCSAYDDWDELNPEGVEYTFSELSDPGQADAALTEGPDRAFIDTASMGFPREDRARIMEYAMMPDNGEVFTSPILQSKLRTLCRGIREAFDLEDSEERFLWEQYLEETAE